MNLKLFISIALLFFSITEVFCVDDTSSDILIITIDNSLDNSGNYNSTSYESVTDTMKNYNVSYFSNMYL